MARKQTTGSNWRRGTPEENLSSESLVFKQRGVKKLKPTRIDKGAVNFNGQMNRVFREIPAHGKRVKTNLSRTLLEERE